MRRGGAQTEAVRHPNGGIVDRATSVIGSPGPGYAPSMPDDARDTTHRERPGTPRPTGEAPQKPASRKLPVGAYAAIFFGLLVLLAVVIALVATLTGGGGNGQTTGMAPALWAAALG